MAAILTFWAVQLCGSDFIVERRMALLSPDKKARAERFLFEHHRRTYVLSRGILRELLGRYTSIPPAKIRFSYGSKSKRGLVPSIQFNCFPILPSWGCMPMTRNMRSGRQHRTDWSNARH